MPCFSIQKNQVDFQNVDYDTLIDGLNAAGHSIIGQEKAAKYVRFVTKDTNATITWTDGKLESSQNADSLNASALKLKQEYSRQVVKATAKRFGWLVKTTGENQFEIQRRY